MLKFFKIMFFNSLIFGSLISISSYSWLSMWMGLEINLLSMIPLMSNYKSLYPSEAALKYFIVQSLASVILLFSIILSLNITEFLSLNSNYLLMMIFNSTLFIKMGAAPFHAWFPEVMEGLNWWNCLIMLTWQKITPMILLMYNYQMMTYFFFIVIFCTLISGLLGFNQLSMRKILAYSSINHIGWMIASMMNFQLIWLIYFLIYTIITLNIILILKFLNIFFLKQFFNIMNYNKTLKIFFILNFLSLGGLPPFLGFLPKWLVINNLMQNNFWLISLLLIIFTLITLFFYMRITFSTFLINSNESLIYFTKKMKFLLFFFNLISLLGLIGCTLIFNVN